MSVISRPASFGKMRANAYDFVCNGTEIGGGSIRIHSSELQAKVFEALGFTPEQAEEQFGFLMNAFKFGAPPHGGLAFGFDRLCSLFGGSDSIRDYIAFPKNNAGRDVMLDAPPRSIPRSSSSFICRSERSSISDAQAAQPQRDTTALSRSE